MMFSMKTSMGVKGAPFLCLLNCSQMTATQAGKPKRQMTALKNDEVMGPSMRPVHHFVCVKFVVTFGDKRCRWSNIAKPRRDDGDDDDEAQDADEHEMTRSARKEQ